ncbi:MAG: hypothetical protein QXR48_00470 [Candidatus Woesearchaeota archaeon]
MPFVTEATPGKIIILIFLVLLLIYLITTLFVLNKHIVIPIMSSVT